MKKRIAGIGLAAAMMAGAAAGAHRIDVKPGDSLEGVRDAVRKLTAEQRKGGVEVVLAAGRYRLGNTLKFEAADGGAEGAPVTWRAADGADVVLCGGEEIDGAAFRKVEDAETLAKLGADNPNRGKVVWADISGMKLDYLRDYKKLLGRKQEVRMPMFYPEVFVDGERMTAARWPNEGWATIEKHVDRGTMRNDGSVGDALGHKKKGAEKKEEPRGGTFKFAGDRPLRWAKAPRVWLHGFWCFDWYDSVIPVEKICAESNTITFAAMHTYGVRQGNPSPRRWRAVHLLEELDAPGEFFADGESKRLYMIPKGDLAGKRVSVAGRHYPLVSVSKAKHLRLAGLRIEEGYAQGVTVEGSSRVEITDCRITNVRLQGVTVTGSEKCRVAGCDVTETGTGGVRLEGGDRKKLVRGDNVVEDTLVRNFSQHCLTYASGVHLIGVGNTARHCEISGAPHMAVGVYGNDHLFEYNVVSNVCMSSDDAAAYYKGRNPSCRGNVARWNFWSEIGSPRGHGNAAIYFDDGDGGDVVFGNVFYRCGEPGFGGFGTVFCHGGHSNLVDNCIFVECKRPLGSAPWNQKRWESFLASPLMVKRLRQEVDVTDETWTGRYPELKAIFAPEADEARWNAARNTVFVDCPERIPGRKEGTTIPGILCGRWHTNSTDVVMKGDAGFADRGAKNFTLRPDSAVYRKVPGFEPIPFGKIGLLRRR